MTPLVSVCMPVYNGADYVAAAVETVLAQTLGDFELIVVDNSSTDGTADLLASFSDERMTVHRPGEHLPAVPNWTRTVGYASGRYVKLLCHDDLIKPECLERQVTALDANPQATIAACRREVIDRDGRILISARGLPGLDGVVPGAQARRACIRSGGNPLGEPPCVLFRGDALRQAGPFSDRFPYLVDVDMYLRVLEQGDLVAMPDVLASFRAHAGSWSAAVSRLQSTQTRGLAREYRQKPGSPVTRADVLIGAVRAEFLRLGRRTVTTGLGSRLVAARAGRGSAGK